MISRIEGRLCQCSLCHTVYAEHRHIGCPGCCVSRMDFIGKWHSPGRKEGDAVEFEERYTKEL